MKKVSKTTKLFSLLLAIVFAISTFNSIAFAKTTATKVGEETIVLDNEIMPAAKKVLEGDLSIEQLKNRTLPTADKPDIISAKTIEANGHVNRLWAQESDLYTIIFQNNDGTKTMYRYSYPVKYIDESGHVRDKNNNITNQINKKEYESNYAYVNNNNDIKTYMPKVLSSNNGVLLTNNSIQIELIPIQKYKVQNTDNAILNSASLQGKTNTNESTDNITYATPASALKTQTLSESNSYTDAVIYNGVFGENTSVRYTPCFEGVKEDIILDRYTGTNIFSFIVKTNGLHLQNNNNKYVFTDADSNAIKAELGQLFVYDSTPVNFPSEEEREQVIRNAETGKDYLDSATDKNYNAIEINAQYSHQYSVETIKQNNMYLVTIIVDEKYLKSPDTVYPVFVDPTITIHYNTFYGNTPDYMQDATIYDNCECGNCIQTDNDYSLTNTGELGLIYVGHNTNLATTARSLFNFEWLSSPTNTLAAVNITSAELFVRDLFPSVSYMEIAPYLVKNEWSEATVTGNNSWNNYDEDVKYNSKYVYYNNGVANIGDKDTVGNWYGFDITPYVQNVISGAIPKDQAHGIMLKAVNEANEAKQQHTFASREYVGNPAYILRPALVITYDGIITDHADGTDAKQLFLYSPPQNDICTTEIQKDDYSLYYLQAPTTGKYYLKSVGEGRQLENHSKSAETRISVYFLSSDGLVVNPGTYYGKYAPEVVFNAQAGVKYYFKIWGANTSTKFSFLLTKEYANSNIYQGEIKCYYDTAFRDNRGGVSTINGYMNRTLDLFEKYFRTELTVSQIQWYNFTTNYNTSFEDFSHQLKTDLKGNSITTNIAFIGVSLSDMEDGRKPSEMDVAWPEKNVAAITRQINFERIPSSIFHEIAHNYGTYDHYCYLKYTNENHDNDHCYEHTLNDEYHFSNTTDIRCVMNSPVFYPTSMCGLCIRDIYNHLSASNSGHAKTTP